MTRQQLRDIAEKKMKDLNANDIEAASRIIEGSARAMGLAWWRARIMANQAPRVTGPGPRQSYTLAEAIKLVKANAKAKFDETIEIAVNLGVDPRHADQNVRGVVSLPSGTGRDVRVAVIAKDAKAEEAKAAGAEIVGAEDLVERIQGGFMEFDR